MKKTKIVCFEDEVLLLQAEQTYTNTTTATPNYITLRFSEADLTALSRFEDLSYAKITKWF